MWVNDPGKNVIVKKIRGIHKGRPAPRGGGGMKNGIRGGGHGGALTSEVEKNLFCLFCCFCRKPYMRMKVLVFLCYT